MKNLLNTYAVILAGGSGTRFWPVSRQLRPKQFLALSSSKESLIQATARRIEPLVGSGVTARLFVVTNQELSNQVNDHVPNAKVIAEPFGRNTAASIGLAALHVAAENADGIMIVLPADHSVANEEALRSVLQSAVNLANETNSLVTIGIRPEFPNTAYGYIQRGKKHAADCYSVARFYEKPNLERAEEYCASDSFYWNSGMFVWKAKSILNAFKEHMPELFSSLEVIKENLNNKNSAEVLKNEFEKLDSISIDFGVLEHSHNCMMVDAKPFGWNDVGSWDAWANQFSADKAGNVYQGDILQVQSRNCIGLNANSNKKVVAMLGLENIVAVDTDNALLICDRSKVQDVKLIVEALRKNNRSELL